MRGVLVGGGGAGEGAWVVGGGGAGEAAGGRRRRPVERGRGCGGCSAARGTGSGKVG